MRLGGYCRVLGGLLGRLEPLASIYRLTVEPVMGYPGWRESLAQARASCDLNSVCLTLARLASRVEGAGVCIYGPEARGLLGCDVEAGPESALALALAEGTRLDYVTGDMDAGFKYMKSAWAATKVYIAHLHGDNMHSQPPIRVEILYSTQVEPWTPCIIGPLGFTDGDRAVVLAMALGAREVRLVGFTHTPLSTHKDSTSAWKGKEVKLGLASKLLVEAARAMGYRLQSLEKGFPEVLQEAGDR